MPHPTAADMREAAGEGLFGHISGLLAGLSGYMKGRLELAGIEAKEAAIHYAIIVGLVLAALFVMLFGYIFFCFFLIFGLAALIGGQYAWIWVTLGVALLHFGAAVGCVLYAKSRLAVPQFTATMNEFRKDQEWLTPTASVS